MNSPGFAVSVALLLVAAAPAVAAEDPQLQRLATCKDSWFEWKDDVARSTAFVHFMQAKFVTADQGATFTPKAPMSLLGLPVKQVFPQSVGMGVGFSVIVDADFAKTRQIFEKEVGHALACETSDGMKSCELKIAEKKSAVLMTPEDGNAKTSLIGCYYFYEK